MRFFFIIFFGIVGCFKTASGAQTQSRAMLTDILPTVSIDYHYLVSDDSLWSNENPISQHITMNENEWRLFFLFRWEFDVERTAEYFTHTFDESLLRLSQYTPQYDLEREFENEKEFKDEIKE